MIYLAISTLFYSLFLIFIAYASRALDAIAVGMIGNMAAAIIPTILYFQSADTGRIFSNKFGSIMAIIAGVAITFYSLAIVKSFETNNVAIVTPVVFGGSIVISSLAGIVLFKERLSPMTTVGLVLVVAGIACIIYAKSALR